MQLETRRSQRPWLSAAGMVGLACWVAVMLDVLGWLNLWIVLVTAVVIALLFHWVAPKRTKPPALARPAFLASAGAAAAAFIYIHSHSSFVPLSGSIDYGLNVRLTDTILGEHRLHGFAGKIDEMRHYPWGAHVLAATFARALSIETARAVWLVTFLAFVTLVVSASSLVASAAADLGFGTRIPMAAPVTIIVIVAAGHYTLEPIMASYFFAQYLVTALTLAALARSASCPDGSVLELGLMGSGLVFVYTNQALVGLAALAVIELHRGRFGNWRHAAKRVGALVAASALAAGVIAPSVLSTRFSVARAEGIIPGISVSHLGGATVIVLVAMGLFLCLPRIGRRGSDSVTVLATLVGSAALYFVANALLEHPLDRTSRYNTIKSFYPLAAAALPLAGLAILGMCAFISRRGFRSVVAAMGLVLMVPLSASAHRFLKPRGPGITLSQITFMRRAAEIAPVQSISFAAPGTLPFVLALGFGGYPKDGSENMLLTRSTAPPTDYLLVLDRRTLPRAVLDEATSLRLLLRSGDMELRSRSSAQERARSAIKPKGVEVRWDREYGSVNTSNTLDDLPAALGASEAHLLLRSGDRRAQRVRLGAVASAAGSPCTLAVSFDGTPAGRFDVAPRVAFDLHLTLPVGPHSLGFSCEGAGETHPFAVNVVKLSTDTASSSAASVSLVDGLPGWSTSTPGDTVQIAALANFDLRTAPAEVTVHNEGGSTRQDLYAVQTPSDGTATSTGGTSTASAIQSGRRVSARVLLRNHGTEPASVTLAVWSLCTIPTNENVNAIVTRDWRSVRVTVKSKGCPMRVELYPHPPQGRLATIEVAPLLVSIDD